MSICTNWLDGTFGDCIYRTPTYICAGDGFIVDATFKPSALILPQYSSSSWVKAVEGQLQSLKSHPNFRNVSVRVQDTGTLFSWEARARITGESVIDRSSEEDIISDVAIAAEAAYAKLASASIRVSRRGKAAPEYKEQPKPSGGARTYSQEDSLSKYAPYAIIALLGLILVKAVS